jgi:ribosome biogenesis GTPase A
MAKAKRQIIGHLKVIDVVLELLDARIPFSSQNPIIPEITKGKKRIILLNKADLSDPIQLERWMNYFSSQGISTLPINAQSGKNVNKIQSLVESLIASKRESERSKGRANRPIRAMILGIPNVGKSTLINQLAGKKKLVVQDRPGVTRQPLYIRVGSTFELLDTPGILWPRFEDENVAKKLALTGAIKDEILPKDEVVIAGFKLMEEKYAGRMEKRYQISVDVNDVLGIYEGIGRKRGCFIRGGEIDYERVSDLFLQDLRSGKLGQICLDWVDDVVSL